MADTTEEGNQEQKDDDKAKKNILEGKSKEELIKLVKKYLNLLQKSKNKIDTLEHEKISIKQELQSKIDDLQQNSLKQANLSGSVLENEQLKQKLKEAEDQIQILSLRENEEQLQCLTLQLQTMKASCQCIQEENTRLKKSYEEKLKENADLSFDLKMKTEEYESLSSVKKNTEAKFEEKVEEIHLLKTQNKELLNKNINLEENFKKMEEHYKKLEVEYKELMNSDQGILFNDLRKYQNENEELKKVIKSKKSSNQRSLTIAENEIDKSGFKVPSELRNEAYDSLEKEKLSLEAKNKSLQSELHNCQQEILELKNEIKNVVNANEIGDYKLGIELALLHGAPTDKIICPVEPLNSGNEISQFKNSEIKEKNNEVLKHEYYPFEDASGLEYALLQGGDASKLIATNAESSSDVYGNMFGPSNDTINVVSELNSGNIAFDYEVLLQKHETLCKRYEAEKKTLQKNLDEYSSLCEETMKENEELKQELKKAKENLKVQVPKIVCHRQTNTESECSKYPEETDNSDILSDRVLTSKNQMKCENCSNLCREIVRFYNMIESNKNLDIRQESMDVDHLALLKRIKNLYNKMADELVKTKYELNEYNLQLELLVIGVKQGVRQKKSSYQAENNPEENINALKVLVEDLVSRSSCFDSRLKMLQSETNNKMQEMEDHINQLKELNQFLEDENTELSDEVQKLKSNLNDSIKDLTNYTEDTYLQNTELYSIDESCEFDSRTDTNCNIKLNKRNTNICDISVQAFPTIQDCAVQVEDDSAKEDKITQDIDIQTDCDEENFKSIIEQLKNENESLKKIADEKSNLVENIHCQLDSLLAKVENLTDELRIKDDDLKCMKQLNADLEKMVSDAGNIKNQQMNNLKAAVDLVLECKRKNNDLNCDVKSLSSTFEELFSNVQTNILNVINENCKNIDCFAKMCNHKENSLTVIKNWVLELAAEFEYWLNIIDRVNLESSLDLSEISSPVERSSLNTSLFEELYHEDACCSIVESITNLNSYKLKLFSAFYNHLNNNYSLLVKEIHSYKADIIPKMEKKLAEYVSKNEAEMLTKTESVQEQTSEDSLRKTLEETEIKMNKFKQIAVKLKKDLVSTKEQYNEVISENEKLQKQNAKLLDEISKLTEDQCKYVQNYQTLQKEFDKLQDDCEMHRDNTKKLEEDIATKLHELNRVKEQVADLENQLKSSKNLFETNLSVKKELDSKCADLESKIIILESKLNEKEQKLNSKDLEIAKYLKDLSISQEDNMQLKNQLELAQREGNKKSLLDLEMADFERSITELNNKIKKKEDEIEELQKEIKSLEEKNDCLHEQLKTTESLKETEAKRAVSLRDILEKTKSELNEAKEHEAELLSKTALLEVRLESMTQQEEHLKIQLSEASAQMQHLQDVIKTSSDNHQRIVRSLEQKISNQKEEILVAQKEVESVNQEFENYKIRVHSVLKQQKSVHPAIASVDSDLKEKLETVNEKLKLQVKELSEKLTAMTLEYDSLQEEHQNLLQRYDKLVEDTDKKDKEWNHRIELMNAEKNRLRTAQEELSSQHLLQNEMLVATYKKQIKIMSEEHKKTVNDLQKQLDAADVEIARLQRDQQKLQGLPVTPSPQDSTTSFDLLSQERQEGEGSENTDETNTPIKHLSLATIPTSGFLSFEKLLQSPVEPGTPASYVSSYGTEKLAADLNTANKRIDHLSELLNDSESTNLRLSEQVRVLKEEVRRLENNKDRQQHAENLEYLKNVFIKFATLQPGSERAMLIPVLTTMLKLNSNEQQQLKSVAGDAQSDDNMNSGWGSYLHRWSGLS